MYFLLNTPAYTSPVTDVCWLCMTESHTIPGSLDNPSYVNPEFLINEQKDPNIFQIAHSILAAFIGVQSKKNHERDDAYVEKIGLKPYIIMGIVMVIVFHLVLYAIVKIITMSLD